MCFWCRSLWVPVSGGTLACLALLVFSFLWRFLFHPSAIEHDMTYVCSSFTPSGRLRSRWYFLQVSFFISLFVFSHASSTLTQACRMIFILGSHQLGGRELHVWPHGASVETQKLFSWANLSRPQSTNGPALIPPFPRTCVIFPCDVRHLDDDLQG